MNVAITALLALVLILAPWLAALPDDTISAQPFWSSWLSVLIMAAALLGIVQAWRKNTEAPPASPEAPPTPNNGATAPDGGAGKNAGATRVGARRNASSSRAAPSFGGVASSPAPPLLGAGGASSGTGGASPVTLAFLTLLGLAALSVIWRLISQHSAAYLGLMLRGWATLAAQFALFALCRRLARGSRAGLYAVVLAAVFGAAIAAFNGVVEYLIHGFAGAWSWRVFSTSTPDFLAGGLVMLLPVTTALLISSLSRRGQSPVFGLLWGLIAVAQLATLVTTGSRFALVSLTVAAIVFGLAWRASRPQGEGRAPVNARGLIVAAVCIVAVGLLFAKPVLNRLQNSPANSAAFRVWTWKGAARIAAQNPLLGTGIGTWVDTYPPYALTGFTRLAHNAYLQMADECGLPALAALLATLGWVSVAARRGLATPEQALGTSAFLETLAPDDRLLRCGLLAGLTAGVVQNVIDSDWYVFFLGVTFWTLAGLAVGLGERAVSAETAPKTPRARLVLSGLVVAALLILFGTQGIAAFYYGQTQRETDPTAAQSAYGQAQAWDPLNARYPGDLGYRVFARLGNFTAAEASLRAAAAMEPNGVNFQRLAAVREAQGLRAEALSAYQDGLRVDPNKLDLLLGAARLSPPAEALTYYRKMAALEDGPVGRVRAIGELTEPKFAEADAALAQAAAQAGDKAETVHYAQRAADVLEAYARESGTANSQRQILNGFRPQPNDDVHYRDLYARVMVMWADAAPAGQKLAVRSRAQDYAMRFQAILAQDHAALGDQASTEDDTAQAATDYSRAAEILQIYADAGGTHSGQKQGLTDSRTDPALDAQMGTLYGHVMERLLALAPLEQRAALTDRARLYAAKFAALVSPG